MFCLKCGLPIDNVICDFCGKTNNETCLNNLLTSDAEMLKEILHHKNIDKVELQTTHDEMVETSFEHRQIQTRGLEQESQKPVDESNAVKKDKTRNNIKKHILKYACTMIPILLVAAALGAGIGIISSKDDSGYILTEESSFEETSSESESATVTSQSAADDENESSYTSTSSNGFGGDSVTNNNVQSDLADYIAGSIDPYVGSDSYSTYSNNIIEKFEFYCCEDKESNNDGTLKYGENKEEFEYFEYLTYKGYLYLPKSKDTTESAGEKKYVYIFNDEKDPTYNDKYIYIITESTGENPYSHCRYYIIELKEIKFNDCDGIRYECSVDKESDNGISYNSKESDETSTIHTSVTTNVENLDNGMNTDEGSSTDESNTESPTENNNGNDGDFDGKGDEDSTSDNSGNQNPTEGSPEESNVETSDDE